MSSESKRRLVPMAGERGSGTFTAMCVCASLVTACALTAVVSLELFDVLTAEPNLVFVLFSIVPLTLLIGSVVMGVLALVATVVLAVVFAVTRHRGADAGDRS